MAEQNIKENARRLVDRLPDESTWDDLMHEIYVRQAVEAGLADSNAGRLSTLRTTRKKFGLSGS